ncbi:hypothetical protein ACLOJK_036940 [Asimina triloba]
MLLLFGRLLISAIELGLAISDWAAHRMEMVVDGRWLMMGAAVAMDRLLVVEDGFRGFRQISDLGGWIELLLCFGFGPDFWGCLEVELTSVDCDDCWPILLLEMKPDLDRCCPLDGIGCEARMQMKIGQIWVWIGSLPRSDELPLLAAELRLKIWRMLSSSSRRGI